MYFNNTNSAFTTPYPTHPYASPQYLASDRHDLPLGQHILGGHTLNSQLQLPPTSLEDLETTYILNLLGITASNNQSQTVLSQHDQITTSDLQDCIVYPDWSSYLLPTVLPHEKDLIINNHVYYRAPGREQVSPEPTNTIQQPQPSGMETTFHSAHTIPQTRLKKFFAPTRPSIYITLTPQEYRHRISLLHNSLKSHLSTTNSPSSQPNPTFSPLTKKSRYYMHIRKKYCHLFRHTHFPPPIMTLSASSTQPIHHSHRDQSINTHIHDETSTLSPKESVSSRFLSTSHNASSSIYQQHSHVIQALLDPHSTPLDRGTAEHQDIIRLHQSSIPSIVPSLAQLTIPRGATANLSQITAKKQGLSALGRVLNGDLISQYTREYEDIQAQARAQTQRKLTERGVTARRIAIDFDKLDIIREMNDFEHELAQNSPNNHEKNNSVNIKCSHFKEVQHDFTDNLNSPYLTSIAHLHKAVDSHQHRTNNAYIQDLNNPRPEGYLYSDDTLIKPYLPHFGNNPLNSTASYKLSSYVGPYVSVNPITEPNGHYYTVSADPITSQPIIDKNITLLHASAVHTNQYGNNIYASHHHQAEPYNNGDFALNYNVELIYLANRLLAKYLNRFQWIYLPEWLTRIILPCITTKLTTFKVNKSNNTLQLNQKLAISLYKLQNRILSSSNNHKNSSETPQTTQYMTLYPFMKPYLQVLKNTFSSPVLIQTSPTTPKQSDIRPNQRLSLDLSQFDVYNGSLEPHNHITDDCHMHNALVQMTTSRQPLRIHDPQLLKTDIQYSNKRVYENVIDMVYPNHDSAPSGGHSLPTSQIPQELGENVDNHHTLIKNEQKSALSTYYEWFSNRIHHTTQFLFDLSISRNKTPIFPFFSSISWRPRLPGYSPQRRLCCTCFRRHNDHNAYDKGPVGGINTNTATPQSVPLAYCLGACLPQCCGVYTPVNMIQTLNNLASRISTRNNYSSLVFHEYETLVKQKGAKLGISLTKSMVEDLELQLLIHHHYTMPDSTITAHLDTNFTYPFSLQFSSIIKTPLLYTISPLAMVYILRYFDSNDTILPTFVSHYEFFCALMRWGIYQIILRFVSHINSCQFIQKKKVQYQLILNYSVTKYTQNVEQYLQSIQGNVDKSDLSEHNDLKDFPQFKIIIPPQLRKTMENNPEMMKNECFFCHKYRDIQIVYKPWTKPTAFHTTDHTSSEITSQYDLNINNIHQFGGFEKASQFDSKAYRYNMASGKIDNELGSLLNVSLFSDTYHPRIHPYNTTTHAASAGSYANNINPMFFQVFDAYDVSEVDLDHISEVNNLSDPLMPTRLPKNINKTNHTALHHNYIINSLSSPTNTFSEPYEQPYGINIPPPLLRQFLDPFLSLFSFITFTSQQLYSLFQSPSLFTPYEQYSILFSRAIAFEVKTLHPAEVKIRQTSITDRIEHDAYAALKQGPALLQSDALGYNADYKIDFTKTDEKDHTATSNNLNPQLSILDPRLFSWRYRTHKKPYLQHFSIISNHLDSNLKLKSNIAENDDGMTVFDSALNLSAHTAYIGQFFKNGGIKDLHRQKSNNSVNNYRDLLVKTYLHYPQSLSNMITQNDPKMEKHNENINFDQKLQDIYFNYHTQIRNVMQRTTGYQSGVLNHLAEDGLDLDKNAKYQMNQLAISQVTQFGGNSLSNRDKINAEYADSLKSLPNIHNYTIIFPKSKFLYHEDFETTQKASRLSQHEAICANYITNNTLLNKMGLLNRVYNDLNMNYSFSSKKNDNILTNNHEETDEILPQPLQNQDQNIQQHPKTISTVDNPVHCNTDVNKTIQNVSHSDADNNINFSQMNENIARYTKLLKNIKKQQVKTNHSLLQLFCVFDRLHSLHSNSSSENELKITEKSKKLLKNHKFDQLQKNIEKLQQYKLSLDDAYNDTCIKLSETIETFVNAPPLLQSVNISPNHSNIATISTTPLKSINSSHSVQCSSNNTQLPIEPIEPIEPPYYNNTLSPTQQPISSSNSPKYYEFYPTSHQLFSSTTPSLPQAEQEIFGQSLNYLNAYKISRNPPKLYPSQHQYVCPGQCLYRYNWDFAPLFGIISFLMVVIMTGCILDHGVAPTWYSLLPFLIFGIMMITFPCLLTLQRAFEMASIEGHVCCFSSICGVPARFFTPDTSNYSERGYEQWFVLTMYSEEQSDSGAWVPAPAKVLSLWFIGYFFILIWGHWSGIFWGHGADVSNLWYFIPFYIAFGLHVCFFWIKLGSLGLIESIPALFVLISVAVLHGAVNAPDNWKYSSFVIFSPFYLPAAIAIAVGTFFIFSEIDWEFFDCGDLIPLLCWVFGWIFTFYYVGFNLLYWEHILHPTRGWWKPPFFAAQAPTFILIIFVALAFFWTESRSDVSPLVDLSSIKQKPAPLVFRPAQAAKMFVEEASYRQ